MLVPPECQRAGYTVGMQDPEAAGLLVLSIAHGRVALAHTAPDRGWNKPDQVLAFVTAAVENMETGHHRPPSTPSLAADLVHSPQSRCTI
jgi:hypothetical protein